jgi:hypothetical protein
MKRDGSQAANHAREEGEREKKLPFIRAIELKPGSTRRGKITKAR